MADSPAALSGAQQFLEHFVPLPLSWNYMPDQSKNNLAAPLEYILASLAHLGTFGEGTGYTILELRDQILF
jgi:hypothetical protein